MNKIFQPKVVKGSLFVVATLSIFYYAKRKSNENKFAASFVKSLPLRMFSRLFGKLSEKELPYFVKMPIFYTYSFVYGIDLKEIGRPLSTFNRFSSFFSRSLDITRLRPIAKSDLVSPVDGKVISLGRIDSDELVDTKGIHIPLENFLGHKTEAKQLHYAVLYLSPGDYHRFHSPAKWRISKMSHFSGELLPVSPKFTKLFPRLFCTNERVVLEGRWKHGFFSFAPIGAFNVGSIKMSPLISGTLETNLPGYRTSGNVNFKVETPFGIEIEKAVELGLFKTGSSVILIFEVPSNKNFLFRLKEGQKIKVGEEMGFVY